MTDESGLVMVEFRLDHPILRQALNETPDTTITWERSDPIDDDRIRVLLWAESEDHERFAAALSEDPTVSGPRRTVDIDGRRLYQLDLVGRGRETSIYPLLVDLGGIVHDLTASHEGWEFRASFPTVDDFDRFREHCEVVAHDFVLHKLFVRDESLEDDGCGLTDAQREVLLSALEMGYFDIPRSSSLNELADALGISDNAASERLRRGMRTLVAETLGSNEGPHNDGNLDA